MALVDSRIEDGMLIDDLILAVLLTNPSIYLSVAVIISLDEVVMSHLQREFSAASLYNILCQPVRIDPNSRLARIPIGSLVEE